MRVKDYLKTRGVEFDAFDITVDKTALAVIQKLGIKSVPVVVKGDRHALGRDLGQVDDLVGLKREGSLIPAGELVERTIRILTAWARFAKQLPPSHYDDRTPGMELVKAFILPDGQVLRHADGTPYVPHMTSIGMIRHVLHHAEKIKVAFEDPKSRVFSDEVLNSQCGEPSPALSLEQLLLIGNEVTESIRRCWSNASQETLDTVIQTMMGPLTVHQVLMRETYSVAQHTRQVMTLVIDLGIEPDGPLEEKDFSGLNVPKNVWD